MTYFLIDTNVLSELRRPRPSESVISFMKMQPLDTLWACDISFAEIRFGAELRPDSVGRVIILDWLDNIIRPLFEGRCLQVDEECWLRWKLLELEGRKERYTFPQPDLVIAAVALRHKLTVATRDTAPFEKAGAAVFNPWISAAP